MFDVGLDGERGRGECDYLGIGVSLCQAAGGIDRDLEGRGRRGVGERRRSGRRRRMMVGRRGGLLPNEGGGAGEDEGETPDEVKVEPPLSQQGEPESGVDESGGERHRC